MLKIKKTAIVCITFIILISCNNNPSGVPTINSTNDSFAIVKTEIDGSKLDEAKKTAKNIFEYVEQAETKKITKKQLDLKARPLQNHLDSLRLVLTKSEIEDLDSYRTQLVSEMVDRKVIRDRK